MARRDVLLGKRFINPIALVRLENAAAKACAALGHVVRTDREPEGGDGALTLDQILAERPPK